MPANPILRALCITSTTVASHGLPSGISLNLVAPVISGDLVCRALMHLAGLSASQACCWVSSDQAGDLDLSHLSLYSQLSPTLAEPLHEPVQPSG